MIYPKFLSRGDTIGVPAPSDGTGDNLDIKRYKNAVKKFDNMGYKIELSDNMFKSHLGRSASANVRASELNKMFEDENIKAVICGAGGEFAVEILPYINFECILKNPKWVQGFSDPTLILYILTTKYDIATIYSRNFKSFGAENYHKSLEDNLKILQGNIINQESFELYEEERKKYVTGYESDNLTKKVSWKILNSSEVNVEGRCLAGCFDSLFEIIGTKYDTTSKFLEKYKDDGIVWFFDVFDKSKEELIRNLWLMNEHGYFKYAKCIVFGRCAFESSYLDYTMETCLKDSIINNLNIPIVYDADVSHKAPCLNFINGSIVNLTVEDEKGKISFKLI